MPLDDLADVYADQLQDLYSACEQSIAVTEDMSRAASDRDLTEALADGANGIRRGQQQIARLCAAHGIDPEGEPCKAMQGLVEEARAHALEPTFGADDVRDAMIITQYQRLCHYAIAGYGCARAFAQRLGNSEDAAVLEECLRQSYRGDDRMTRIATQGGVNRDAA